MLSIFNQKEFIPVERDEELVQRVKSLTEEKGLKETVLTFDKQQRDENLDALKAEIATEFVDEAIQKMSCLSMKYMRF